MCVRPRDPERADRRPRGSIGVGGPRRRFGRYPYRQAVPVNDRGRVLEVQVRRDHSVVHGQRGLDERRHPRRGLQVADVRLHRADQQRSVGRATLAVHRRRRLHFDGVAHHGAVPVGLEVVHLRGSDPRARQRGLHHRLLGYAVRHRWAGARPALVDRRSADDPPDPVAVGFRFAEPLERHHAATFAPREAVGAGVEGPAASGRREHAERHHFTRLAG